MSKKYYFAGVRLSVPEMEMPEHWKQFEKEIPYQFDMHLSLSDEPLDAAEEESKAYGRANVVKKEDRWLFLSSVLHMDVNRLKSLAKKNGANKNSTGDSVDINVNNQADNDGPWGLSASLDYSNCVLHSEGNDKKAVGTLHTAVDAALPLHGGSIIHASCVIYQGKAILFCGPSGMGKSTQARLWNERFGTYMISSDAPAVYPTADGAIAYGMPWDGSDQIITQESAPVAAVIELAQAKENRITRMSESQACQRMLQQGHLPLWDSTAMFCEMQVLKQIAVSVPFYHLECLPNAEAAELVERTVFNFQGE